MTALPMIAVACATQGCGACGVVRRVRLKPAALGLVEAPRLLCTGCGLEPQTVQGWPAMSTDEATEEATEGTDMPKITVHGGPSNAAESVTAAETPPAEPAVEPAVAAPAPLDQNSGETGDQADDQAGSEAPPFDPAAHTVVQVNEYIAAAVARGDDTEAARVIEAERVGKARRGILADE
jgi:hypothetical protein